MTEPHGSGVVLLGWNCRRFPLKTIFLDPLVVQVEYQISAVLLKLRCFSKKECLLHVVRQWNAASAHRETQIQSAQSARFPHVSQ